MFAARRSLAQPWVARQATTLLPQASARKFHSSTRGLVNVGDAVPDAELMEGSPGNKVSISNVLKGKGLIIGVPAAFSPSCSAKHIPGYINYEGLKDAGDVFVVSVNDAFVMKAWQTSLDPDNKSGVRGSRIRSEH